jgi:hypothetical protein
MTTLASPDGHVDRGQQVVRWQHARWQAHPRLTTNRTVNTAVKDKRIVISLSFSKDSGFDILGTSVTTVGSGMNVSSREAGVMLVIVTGRSPPLADLGQSGGGSSFGMLRSRRNRSIRTGVPSRSILQMSTICRLDAIGITVTIDTSSARRDATAPSFSGRMEAPETRVPFHGLVAILRRVEA